MRPLGIALAASLASSGLLAGSTAAGTSPPTVDLTMQPVVALLHGGASITIYGIAAASLQVRLAGATGPTGRPLPWQPLTFAYGAWRGTLSSPRQRGIYPIRLRVRRGSTVLLSKRWLFRVFARGTLSRPSFATPRAVVRWWVRTLPGRQRLAALRRWPRSASDRRDPQLHRVYVVAYSRAADTVVSHRLGMFVTAVRDGFHGRWRLLQATVGP
jgi:hypothetical protein